MQGKGLVEIQVLCNVIQSRTINDGKSRLWNSRELIIHYIETIYPVAVQILT